MDKKWRIFGAAILSVTAIVVSNNHLSPMVAPEKAEAAPHSYSLVTPHVDAGKTGPLPAPIDTFTVVGSSQSESSRAKVGQASVGPNTQRGAAGSQPSAGNVEPNNPSVNTDSNQKPAIVNVQPDPVVLGTDGATISASIPVASFGADDGLPPVLVRGQSYTVAFPVIAADPTQVQTASLVGRGLVFDSACQDYALVVAQVTDVTCVVTVRANALNAQVRAVVGTTGSKIIRHTVDSTIRATSVVTATPAAATSQYGQAASINVSATAPGYTPTGTVTATIDGLTNTAPVRLVGGAATISLPTTLAVGVHTVATRYSGDAWLSSVITSTSVVTVVKASPVITPTLTIGSSGAGLSVSVSATGIPSLGGSVSVSEFGQQLSRANVVGGVAEVGLPITLTSGAHTFTVTYSGFGNVDVGSTTVTVSLP